jgi:hypothetical protein
MGLDAIDIAIHELQSRISVVKLNEVKPKIALLLSFPNSVRLKRYDRGTLANINILTNGSLYRGRRTP